MDVESLLSVSEPTSIRVQMRSELEYDGETNYEYWGVDDEDVVSINFQNYSLPYLVVCQFDYHTFVIGLHFECSHSREFSVTDIYFSSIYFSGIITWIVNFNSR